jgi:hypothetical protein
MTGRDELAAIRRGLRVLIQHAYVNDYPARQHAPSLSVQRHELVSLLDEIDRLEKIVEAMAVENSGL